MVTKVLLNLDIFYGILATTQYFKLWKSAIMDQFVMFRKIVFCETYVIMNTQFGYSSWKNGFTEMVCKSALLWQCKSETLLYYSVFCPGYLLWLVVMNHVAWQPISDDWILL